MNFNLKTPCKDCPFRSDREANKGWLGKERAESIINSITKEDATFQCHKTLGNKAEHCAGATILLEKLEKPNQLMRIAERLGHYDLTKLDMNAPVMTAKEFIKCHTN
jgi:hypothetical protein